MSGLRGNGCEAEAASESRSLMKLPRLETLLHPFSPSGQQLSDSGQRPDFTPSSNRNPKSKHTIKIPRVAHTREGAATARLLQQLRNMSGREETASEAAENQNIPQGQGPREGGISAPSQAVEAPVGSPQSGDKRQESVHGADTQASNGSGDAQDDQDDRGVLDSTRSSALNSPSGGSVQGSGSGPSNQATGASNAAAQSHSSTQRKPRLVTRGEFASLSASRFVPASSFSAVDTSVRLSGKTSPLFRTFQI
ncbi:unnamed protein product [Phytophthora fragariaefolia]|uniref:Unnamed protein product n=1 Tax=Phytophthora fragariaefolia TaxID=1490495 RepID=A0A9W7D2Z3_9STRA|nr:unnamed protein product [Phytophthora fragariaefolia]